MFSDIASIVKTAVGVGAIVGAYFWHQGQVEAYADELLAQDSAARARGALILTEANIKLKESNDVLTAERDALGRLAERLSAGDQLRRAEIESFKRDLASATKAQLAAYAEAADGNFVRSRSHVERFGREAINCSITSHQQARDAGIVDEAWRAYFNALKGATQ